MSIPGSISTTIMNNHPHQQLYKMPLTSNFLINPDLLRELNARYLHDMNTNRFSTYIHPKHNSSSINKISKPDDRISLSPTKISNKWCTAHVRICWMIYHQQEKRKTNEQQSVRQSDINDPRNLPFHYSRKSTSDYSLPSTIDPFVLSMIERQQLSAAYASLFASVSQGKNNFPMNFDSSALFQRDRFLHFQPQQQQQNKSLKTKFDQISTNNHEETKRIKRDKTK